MSVEKRFLKFDDLKSQVRVSSVTLNERKMKARNSCRRELSMPCNLDQSTRQIPCSTIAVVPKTRGAKLRRKHSLKRMENMDMDLDEIRRFRVSPPPLDNVPKPKKILFEQTNENETNGTNENEMAKRYLTRRDFVASQPRCASGILKQSDVCNMDVAVEVKPKYYQKWARNARAKSCTNDTYNFPNVSLLQSTLKSKKKFKERRSSKKSSGMKKGRLYHLHSSGSLCSNLDNTCDHAIDWESIPRIEVRDFADCYEDVLFSPELSKKTDIKSEKCTDNTRLVHSGSSSDSVNQGTSVNNLIASIELLTSGRHINDCGKDTTDTKPDSSDQQGRPKHSGDLVTSSYNPKLLTVDIDEPEIKYYPNPGTDLIDRKAKTINDIDIDDVHGSKSVKSVLKKSNYTTQEVTLSKQVISTGILDGAVNRLPVVETRLDSPFRLVKDPVQNKPQHYSYYPARPIYNDMQKRREKQSQLTRPLGFDYRRCKTDSNIGLTSYPESRIPIKLATSSPRFSIPDNLIVDFETLRIASHLQKLQNTLSHTPVHPRVFLPDKKVTDSPKTVPIVKNKGFKTVIIGSSVK